MRFGLGDPDPNWRSWESEYDEIELTTRPETIDQHVVTANTTPVEAKQWCVANATGRFHRIGMPPHMEMWFQHPDDAARFSEAFPLNIG